MRCYLKRGVNDKVEETTMDFCISYLILFKL